MNLDLGAFKKASLLEAGLIRIDRDLSSMAERATAGPDAGLKSIFLSFDRYRVRMSIANKPGETPFVLKRSGDGYNVMRRGSVFIRSVTVEKPIVHAPRQIFLNLASPCIFDCKFCATPKLRIRFILEPRKSIALIRSAMSRSVEAIALTSGVVGSERKIVKLMVDTVELIRNEIGSDIPIGLEPYVTRKEHVDELYGTGADEIKVNLESFDERIVKTVCPEMNYNKVSSALEYSVDVFGENKVCSNVLIGLGETDDNVLNGVEYLAERGIVANLRPLFISPYRRKDLAEATQNKAARPTAKRMLKLSTSYRKILENYELNTSVFQTMCHKCTGCEITPQQDV